MQVEDVEEEHQVRIKMDKVSQEKDLGYFVQGVAVPSTIQKHLGRFCVLGSTVPSTHTSSCTATDVRNQRHHCFVQLASPAVYRSTVPCTVGIRLVGPIISFNLQGFRNKVTGKTFFLLCLESISPTVPSSHDPHRRKRDQSSDGGLQREVCG